MFKALLTHGTNQMLFNAQNMAIPLLLAISEKREDMVKRLLHHGADVNLPPENSPDSNLIPINLSVENGTLRI